MDRLTRKELKRDPLALEVQHGFEFLTTHRQQTIRYGTIALAVILLGGAVYLYHRHQQGVREEALAKAMQVNEAPVGAPAGSAPITFATQKEKDQAVAQAFTSLAAKYPGTPEGTVAEFFLAAHAADAGDMAQAEKRFRDIVDNGDGPYVSLGKLSLAKIYASEGKTAEAEKLLRSVVDKPTALVSKEEAQIQLAEVLAKTHPKEAKALLGPLRSSPRAAVSQAAIEAYTALKLD